MYTINIDTDRSGMFNITEDVKRVVEESGVKNGMAIIWNPHSTAGVTVFSPMDDLGYEDMDEEMDRLVPTRVNFKHQFDTPSDASGHIKSAIIGVSLTAIIEDGKLMIGGSQGIFFYEFDGPRSRKCYVKVVGD